MKSTAITLDRLKQHMHYGKWWYISLVIGSVLLWSLVFSVTTPKLPPEQRIELLVTGKTINLASLLYMQDEALAHFAESDGLKEVVLTRYPYLEDSQYFEALKQALAGGMGDILLMPADLFAMLADEGGFIPLEAYVEDGTLLCDAEHREKYTMDTALNREARHLYGVPADSMRYLSRYFYDTTDHVLAVPIYSGNQDTAIAMIGWYQRYYDRDPATEELPIPSHQPQ